MSVRTCLYALVCLAVSAAGVRAQDGPLTLFQALATAREKSPTVIAARARVAEAEAARVAAGMRLDNPEVDAGAGPRFADAGRQIDFGLGVSQMFENGGRRNARISAANEGVASAEARLVAAQRNAAKETAIVFLKTQYLERLVSQLADAVKLASEVSQIAERRFSLGDIAALDVNTARVESSRLESERAAMDAERLAALGDLGALLGASTLPSIASESDTYNTRSLDELLRAIDARPELRAIDADIRHAEARLALAKAAGKPQFGLTARYDRDEGDHVLLGGLVVTLPLFNKGQDVSAEATALIASLRAERDTMARSWSVLVRAKVQSINALRQALEVIERGALPAAIDNEGLARRSYETGQISVVDWIVLRREAMQVRREQLERLRQIAIATVELDAVAGVIQ